MSTQSAQIIPFRGNQPHHPMTWAPAKSDVDSPLPHGTRKPNSLVLRPAPIIKASHELDPDLDRDVFERLALEQNYGQGGSSMETAYQVNQSMRLAQRERFFEMCRFSLWGSENEYEFGEFLRGIVESFLPQNRWDLELLTTVADFQWKVRRLRKLQQGVFESGSKERDDRGVSIRTKTAMSMDEELAEASSNLRKAMLAYYKDRQVD